MQRKFEFFVYIMASSSGTLYVGMTTSLVRRVQEHREGAYEGFTKKYKCQKLVSYEEYQYVYDAINRENQIKKWSREKKEALIASVNEGWRDLALDWVLD